MPEQTIIHVLRTRHITSGKRIWVVFTKDHQLNGDPRHSKEKTINRFEYVHDLTTVTGKKYVQYEGTLRPSEAAMTIVGVQHP